MRLHFYFARRFLVSFAAVFTVFFLLLSLFDLLEQIRRFDGDGVSFQGILTLTALNVPKSVYRILPLITIIATIFLFLSLARSSELVIARAAGRSAAVTLIAPLTVALLIGGASVAVFNPIVAATLKQYETLTDSYQQGGSSTLSISREGLWLRQGNPDGQTVIRAERASLNGTEIIGATFISFSPEGQPLKRVQAERAQLVPGSWELTKAKVWQLSESNNPERDAMLVDSLRLPSDLTAEQIADGFGEPSAIPIWELPEFIARLETAGFSAQSHKVWYHMELSLPLILAAMVLVGAGFTMRHTRFGQTGSMVLMALGLGFVLYFIRNFAQILGESGQIPAAFAAWGPAMAALLLPVGLILHLEDG